MSWNTTNKHLVGQVWRVRAPGSTDWRPFPRDAPSPLHPALLGRESSVPFLLKLLILADIDNWGHCLFSIYIELTVVFDHPINDPVLISFSYFHSQACLAVLIWKSHFGTIICADWKQRMRRRDSFPCLLPARLRNPPPPCQEDAQTLSPPPQWHLPLWWVRHHNVSNTSLRTDPFKHKCSP